MIFVFEEIFILNLKPVLDSSTPQLPPPQIWKKHKLKKRGQIKHFFTIFMGNIRSAHLHDLGHHHDRHRDEKPLGPSANQNKGHD